MNIVVLDGHSLNPGDLSWDPLKVFGHVEVYKRTPYEYIVERAKDAEIIINNKTVMDAHILEQLPKLRYIGILATGYNVVDVECAAQKGIVVSNVRAYSSDSVAQMVFAHILNFAYHLTEHSQHAKNSGWSMSDDFSYWNFPIFEVKGKCLGIIGYGQTGKATAKLGVAFGMKVLVNTLHPPTEPEQGITFCSKEEIFQQSDFVSLHVPLTGATKFIINDTTLRMMKASAYIINTGRGQHVDEEALALALTQERLAGAGLDVLSTEPPKESNPLLTTPNCYITPHIAWATKEARQRLMQKALDNVSAFIAGTPQNVVTT